MEIVPKFRNLRKASFPYRTDVHQIFAGLDICSGFYIDGPGKKEFDSEFW
jgi:hypothetical protein